MNSAKPTVAVLGSTGVVGRAIVAVSSTDPRINKVVAITRRPFFNATSVPPINQSIEESIVPDLHSITPEAFKGASIVYCALGTTRAAEGSAEAFLHNDRDLIIKCANAAKQAGVKSFHLTSSIGADSNAHFLYTKAKGETEDAIRGIGFDHCAIYRPAALDHTSFPRTNKRFAETVLVGLMHYLPIVNRSKWANTRVEDIASAMVNDSFTNNQTPFVLYEGTQEILKMKNHGVANAPSRDL